MSDDQAFYDLLFDLAHTIRALAMHAALIDDRRVDMAVRALKAEAMLKNTRIERDYWKGIALRVDQSKRAWRKRQAAKAHQEAA